MNGYLRDFINDNVGEECGGIGDLTNPTTLQMKVNECLTRLDKLEAGIGFTVKIQDQITLPFILNSGKFISIVPANGIITMASVLASKAGEYDGLESLTVTVHKNSGTITNSVFDINHKNQANTAVTGIQVYTGDWVEMSATPYSYTQGGQIGEDGEITGGSVITSDATLLACLAVLQLPAKTYGVSDAGS